MRDYQHSMFLFFRMGMINYATVKLDQNNNKRFRNFIIRFHQRS